MATCENDDSEEIAPTPHTIPFDTGKGEESEVLFSLDTHPANNIVATGNITGQINLCVRTETFCEYVPRPPVICSCNR